MAAASQDPQTKWICHAIRSGDEAAFNGFFREWAPAIESWSFEYVRPDESLALDIMQETMIRVIRSMPVLETHAALVAWLRVANRSAAIDLLRSRIRSIARERAAARSESGSPRHAADQADLESLFAALSALSPEDQQLLRLRAASDASFEQLAAAIGASPDSLYGRVRRAITKMRTLFAGDSHNA
ncbi:MAG: sigma-70 family RNA polymerase sigma factor [Phycisphaerales bacterium]